MQMNAIDFYIIEIDLIDFNSFLTFTAIITTFLPPYKPDYFTFIPSLK